MEISKLHELFKESTGVCTDTRTIKSGNIFFALKGPNFNANEYAAKALEAGASYAIIDEKEYENDRCILVDDVLKCLQELANYHRKTFDIPVFGITGSNGKTTSKELLATALQPKFQVHYTLGNLNNHIGVPLTLLAMSYDTEIAIIEMGANKIGDIEELCAICEPTHGMITNIGKAHLEGFGSYEGVAKGKSELYYWLLKNDGIVFVNSQDELLMRMVGRFEKEKVKTFPDTHDDYQFTCHMDGPYIGTQTGNRPAFTTQLTGSYNFTNLAAALSVSTFFEVDINDAEKAISDYAPSNNRSQIVKKNGNTVILDAYNANPTSMKAALENFESIEATQKMVILGDMLELGHESHSEHAYIGEWLNGKTEWQILLCGKEMKAGAETCSSANHYNSNLEIIEWLDNNPPKDFTILVKGSRGMKLETVIDHI